MCKVVRIQLRTVRIAQLSEKRTRLIRELVETAALTLLIFLVIRFAAQSFRVDGQSMEPGLHTDEFVLVDKAAYLFQSPGDTVQTTSTEVIVDGQILHEPYINDASNPNDNTLKLGPDQFFVMGDNRNNSFDSRSWGPVNKSYIVGKAILAYWPLSDWELINTFPSVFASIHAG